MEMTTCWCGNAELLSFSAQYGECNACGTLVSLVGMAPDELLVRNDETDFYGKEYWLGHQSTDLGFPNIYARARNDLSERNLHWLKTLLKYRLPPAQVMELGCSHGSFVALLQQAGYVASGVEMSPWVVEFGRMTFDVPISVGPVEALDLPVGSFDAIALMDVLEHLPDPAATMAHCLQLLKPAGLLLIQTPQFKEGTNYGALVEGKSAFLEQLKADEHLYLFSDRSVTSLFERLGAKHIQFEPAIFGHYDMFFVVSRAPLQVNAPERIDRALLETPGGRLTLALLDLGKMVTALQKSVGELGSHRDSAVSQIQTLTKWVEEARAEAEELREYKFNADQQVAVLTEWVEEARAEAEQLRELKFNSEQKVQVLTEEVTALQSMLARPILRLARRLSKIRERFVKKWAGGGSR